MVRVPYRRDVVAQAKIASQRFFAQVFLYTEQLAQIEPGQASISKCAVERRVFPGGCQSHPATVASGW